MTLPVFKNFVSRADWRARPARSTTPLVPSAVRGLAAHYEAAEEADDHSLCDEKVRGIQAYHMDTRRWADIAYNYLVCGHGYIFEGRAWENRSAANGTAAGNDNYAAVCLLSDDDADETEFTAAAQYAFRWLYWRCREKFGDDAAGFLPHSSFKATMCPGNEVRNWLTSGTYRAPIVTVKQHTVVAGETLWSIAVHYYKDGNRCVEIRQANNLKSDVIHPGQILIIP